MSTGSRDRLTIGTGRIHPRKPAVGFNGPGLHRVDWRPWRVLDVDVGQPLSPISCRDENGQALGGVWMLLRVFGEPVGSVQLRLETADLPPDAIAAAIPDRVAQRIRDRLRSAGVPFAEGERMPTGGCTPTKMPPYHVWRERAIESGPVITAVVCTRDQPEGLARCLTSLQAQTYPRTRLLIVDNASSTDAARTVAKASSGPYPIRYVFEARPGLSNARNRSLAEVATELIAWIDDDETADPDWLCEIAGGFMRVPRAAAVCGVMIPGELVTLPQFWFEEYGGHSKGRGFEPAEFSPETRGHQSPLFPLPPFGTGGNMAMRVSAIRKLGGFDRALGTGRRTRGGEDTRALTDILLGGGTVLYQPTALTHHFHRPDYEGLRRQLYGYGSALSAFYTSLLWDRPALLLPLLRLAPRAVRAFRDPEGPRLGSLTERFPTEVLRDHRRGMLRGPLEYARERLAG